MPRSKTRASPPGQPCASFGSAELASPVHDGDSSSKEETLKHSETNNNIRRRRERGRKAPFRYKPRNRRTAWLIDNMRLEVCRDEEDDDTDPNEVIETLMGSEELFEKRRTVHDDLFVRIERNKAARRTVAHVLNGSAIAAIRSKPTSNGCRRSSSFETFVISDELVPISYVTISAEDDTPRWTSRGTLSSDRATKFHGITQSVMIPRAQPDGTLVRPEELAAIVASPEFSEVIVRVTSSMELFAPEPPYSNCVVGCSLDPRKTVNFGTITTTEDYRIRKL